MRQLIRHYSGTDAPLNVNGALFQRVSQLRSPDSFQYILTLKTICSLKQKFGILLCIQILIPRLQLVAFLRDSKYELIIISHVLQNCTGCSTKPNSRHILSPLVQQDGSSPWAGVLCQFCQQMTNNYDVMNKLCKKENSWKCHGLRHKYLLLICYTTL